jgi:hypothetical protein
VQPAVLNVYDYEINGPPANPTPAPPAGAMHQDPTAH